VSDAALIRMANQIAANFGGRAEAAAVEETASHISRFWDPRMRADLLRLVADGKTAGLSSIVTQAASRLR